MRRICLILPLAVASLVAWVLHPETISAQAPQGASYKETLPGSKVSFDMQAIPGGTFLMGTPEGEAGRAADEGPQHEVELKPFWMGKCEVTWDEFDVYWKSEDQPNARKDEPAASKADAITRPTPAYADETFGHGRDGNPVICITHHTAMEYCRWLSRKTGKWYRLPTEAEWEYASGLARKPLTVLATIQPRLVITAGLLTTPRNWPRRSARKNPTHGACTTCTAT